MEPLTVLLDTHTLLWWLFDSAELSPKARVLLGDRKIRVLVSAASAWEIATKFRLGRLPAAAPLVADFAGWIAKAGFVELPITPAHACAAGLLVGEHRDPFDRLLAAQALAEEVAVLGCDGALDDFGTQRLW